MYYEEPLLFTVFKEVRHKRVPPIFPNMIRRSFRDDIVIKFQP